MNEIEHQYDDGLQMWVMLKVNTHGDTSPDNQAVDINL